MRKSLIIEIKRSLGLSNNYEILVAEGTNVISFMFWTRADSNIKPTGQQLQAGRAGSALAFICVVQITHTASGYWLDLFIQTSVMFCQDYINLAQLALQKQLKRIQQAQSHPLVMGVSRGFMEHPLLYIATTRVSKRYEVLKSQLFRIMKRTNSSVWNTTLSFHNTGCDAEKFKTSLISDSLGSWNRMLKTYRLLSTF